MPHVPSITVLGSRVHPVSLDQAVHLIETWVRAGDRGRYVVASGMHGVLEGYREPEFRRILNSADLFVPDGFSMVWLARRRGFQVPGRVCGTELMLATCRRAAAVGHRVFFYGDTEPVLSALQARLLDACPGLQIAGAYSPPFRPLTVAESDEIVQRINAARPDIIWVGLGLPKQEQWIAAHRARLNAAVLVAVGAAFKFASGTVPRAPRWAGEHGLEWLWRFAQEPRRLWRRAFVDVPVFTCLALLELAGWRRPGAAP